MVVVQILGLPQMSGGQEEVEQKMLNDLCKAIQLELSQCLGFTENNICVFFPADRMKQGLGEEIIAYIDDFSPCQDMLSRKKREAVVAVGNVLKENFPKSWIMVKAGPRGDPAIDGTYCHFPD